MPNVSLSDSTFCSHDVSKLAVVADSVAFSVSNPAPPSSSTGTNPEIVNVSLPDPPVALRTSKPAKFWLLPPEPLACQVVPTVATTDIAVLCVE